MFSNKSTLLIPAVVALGITLCASTASAAPSGKSGISHHRHSAQAIAYGTTNVEAPGSRAQTGPSKITWMKKIAGERGSTVATQR